MPWFAGNCTGSPESGISRLQRFILTGFLLPNSLFDGDMPPPEKSAIGTLTDIPISQTKPSSPNRRRMPLKSRTVDTLLRILTLCHTNSSQIIQISDTKNDDTSLFQEQVPMDDTQVVLDTQEVSLCNKHTESAELDHNMSGKRDDLANKFDTVSPISFDVKNQDNNNNYDMMSSSLHLPTNKDVEEGEISGEIMDSMPEIDGRSVNEAGSEPKDFIGNKQGLEKDNNIILLSTNRVESGGKDMAGIVNKTTRNLVDYSDMGLGSSLPQSKRAQSVQRNSKINVTKIQNLVYPVKNNEAQNKKKRKGPRNEEERTNKKSKKSVDPTTCHENTIHENASQEVGDAPVNEGTANENKKKRVLTKERKAKKKMKEKFKRAEKNRKLGVRRLKIQPIIKEKKISYCKHYLKGRCHEGEKCKFSHDTIPETKSTVPCCHFARHSCMKGDDCPFDHQLSKYPCNNYQSKGFCSRGLDCMFYHEAPSSETPSNASNGSQPEQPPPLNSGPKNVGTKSCPIPKSFTSNTEQKVVEITPKSARPPKGISFFSQKKSPRESQPPLKVDSEVKETTKTPPQIQDSQEITEPPPLIQDSTKMSPIIPCGINFLSFGKKPCLDHSNDEFAFKISSGIEKSRLSNIEVEGLRSKSTVNVVNGVKVDFPTDRPSSSQKPIAMPPFMSSTSQKALQSTLAFASKFESCLKTNRPSDSVQKL